MNTTEIINQLVPNVFAESDLTPSQFIDRYWQKYQSDYENNNSINGRIFEKLIGMTLLRHNITPFYMQAIVAFIPNVNYDFIIYCEEIGPIVLSAKTSLRERYKQADLEAVALKNIHRKSESYVISLSESEIQSRKARMDGIMAINNFVYAVSNEYDHLLTYISEKTIILSPTVKAIESKTIITQDNFPTIYD